MTAVCDHCTLTTPEVEALAATIPGLVIHTSAEPGFRAHAEQSAGKPPHIVLGPSATRGPREVLYGVLAHEVAHHLLGHTRGEPRPRARRAVEQAAQTGKSAVLAGTAGIAALTLLDLTPPRWLLASLLALAATAWLSALLILRRWDRAEEIHADLFAVTLLDQLGLPGTACTLAALVDDQPDDEGWPPLRPIAHLFHTRPTHAARIAAVHSQGAKR